jgi:hypothetical protein
LLPRHPLPVTFTEPRGRNARLGLASLALTVCCVFLALDWSPWGWSGVAFFLAATAICAGRARRPATLRLDEDGFEET